MLGGGAVRLEHECFDAGAYILVNVGRHIIDICCLFDAAAGPVADCAAAATRVATAIKRDRWGTIVSDRDKMVTLWHFPAEPHGRYGKTPRDVVKMLADLAADRGSAAKRAFKRRPLQAISVVL